MQVSLEAGLAHPQAIFACFIFVGWVRNTILQECTNLDLLVDDGHHDGDDGEGLVLHVDDGQPLAPLQPGPVLGDLLCLLLGHEPPPLGAQFRCSGSDQLRLSQNC